MVLLISTLLDLYVTIHAEQAEHSFLPEMDQSIFRLFFSDLSIQGTISGIHPYIFIKKIQFSSHPKLINMEMIVTGISNVFLL